ncbi:MAG: DUF4872 domain-containing protein [Planctomycetes bacterium]|nr:DUF4872 domain-containing protein [Planctomycetota bacterium]MCB9904403.1 DUF4872 domain-containing protein [Planctomycetota bacterium]
MTRGRSFKREVRARMEKTGERYTAARARILAKWAPTETADDGAYPFSPGLCRDTGAARNWLHALGVRELSGGKPLSEALLTGLSGGVGFLYMVFEYKGLPPLLSVLTRYDTCADQFVIGGLTRLGIDARITETTSAKKARAELDAALEAGTGALCVVDSVTLAQSAAARELTGMVPTVVAVVGEEGGELLVDCGGAEPLRTDHASFAKARAGYKKAKHRMLTAQRDAQPSDLAGAVHGAVDSCLERYENAPFKGFASNFGFAGMEKWARLLTDERDPKGWPRLFPDGRAACLGLRRAFEGLEHEMTSTGAGRFAYADFLRDAARITGCEAYASAAERYDGAAKRWSAVAESIAACDVREVRSGCELLDAYSELLDAQAPSAERESLAARLSDSSKACDLDVHAARAIYAQLSELVQEAVDTERQAVEALSGAVAVRS